MRRIALGWRLPAVEVTHVWGGERLCIEFTGLDVGVQCFTWQQQPFHESVSLCPASV